MKKVYILIFVAALFAGLADPVTVADSSHTVSAAPLSAVPDTTSPKASTYVVTGFADAQSPVTKKIKSSWSWYLARASGLVAAVLLVVLLVSGVGMVTGSTFKFLEPLVAWAAHRAVGIAFGVAVLVHVFSLLFDKFVGFNFADLLIPFISHYKPTTILGVNVGSLWVALGTFALYLVIAIIVTSLLWIEKKPRPWKFVHFASYTLLVLTFVHGVFLGTDLSKGIFRMLWIIGGVLLILPLMTRLWRAYTLGGKR
jgi:DMSO/TMAO reductase YedYZ heme-binding membrane subunit